VKHFDKDVTIGFTCEAKNGHSGYQYFSLSGDRRSMITVGIVVAIKAALPDSAWKRVKGVVNKLNKKVQAS
jgi:hypothetical protein